MTPWKKNNIQHLSSMEQIKSLNNLQTPCYILDVEELEKSVRGFQTALDKNFNNSIIGYSVKTNSTPYCMKLAGEFGAFAEVVSHDEYELARLCGFNQNRIIYNGPMKSKETFIDAIINGAIVNIEAKREIDWLYELPQNKQYNIGLRLNININHISPEDADGNDDDSRFGLSDDSPEFRQAIETINNIPHVRLAGLHIHRTAHSRSIRFYQKSIDYACRVIKKYNLKLDYLDVGGGYFGIFPNKPTYQQYSDAFYEVLKSHELCNLCIIVEPGNALVASSFDFLTEVIDVKNIEKDKWFITTDGSRNDVDPFFKKTSYLDEEIYLNDSAIVSKQIVSGCTCLEYDRLFTLENKPLLSVGDRIKYKNVGAYTMCLTPMFIRYIPNIYAKKVNEYFLIREKWTAKDYIHKSKI